MKKTLTKKIIKGKEYFYLVYRKNGVLKSQYLGGASSAKYKNGTKEYLNNKLQVVKVVAKHD